MKSFNRLVKLHSDLHQEFKKFDCFLGVDEERTEKYYLNMKKISNKIDKILEGLKI